MPRRASNSIDALVQEAIDDAVERATNEIARAIADMAADELTSRLESQAIAAHGRGATRKQGRAPLPGQGRSSRGRRPASAEMTRWAADRRARRVPTFVIELTGLATKKEIVAKYGEDAAFEKGKPAPKPRP